MTSNSPIDFISLSKFNPNFSLQELVSSSEFNSWFTNYLSEKTVTIEFTKKNGESRKMKCTRNMSIIPKESQPRGIREFTTSIPAFDLDKGEWRSFLPENITNIQWSN